MYAIPYKVSKDGQNKRKTYVECSCQILTKADLFSYPLYTGISGANKVYEIIVEGEKKETHAANVCFYVYSVSHSEGPHESFVIKLSMYFSVLSIRLPKTIILHYLHLTMSNQ